MDVILLCLVTAGRSFFLSFFLVFFFFCASTYTRSHILYCARWYTNSKGKKWRQKRERMSSKKKRERWREGERARANERMMCRGHSYTRMYYKKAFASLFIRLSFFLMFASFFWHFSSVFLSFSCPPRRCRPYRYSSILEPQCFLSVPSPCVCVCVCTSDGRGEE